jgi:hypothetical protein
MEQNQLLPTISAPNILARDISAQTFHHLDISKNIFLDMVFVAFHNFFLICNTISNAKVQKKLMRGKYSRIVIGIAVDFAN